MSNVIIQYEIYLTYMKNAAFFSIIHDCVPLMPDDNVLTRVELRIRQPV